MIRWVLRVFGIPIASLDTIHYEFETEEEEDEPAIQGGSAHNFERAETFVDERYAPWEDKTFGFGRGL